MQSEEIIQRPSYTNAFASCFYSCLSFDHINQLHPWSCCSQRQFGVCRSSEFATAPELSLFFWQHLGLVGHSLDLSKEHSNQHQPNKVLQEEYVSYWGRRHLFCLSTSVQPSPPKLAKQLGPLRSNWTDLRSFEGYHCRGLAVPAARMPLALSKLNSTGLV